MRRATLGGLPEQTKDERESGTGLQPSLLLAVSCGTTINPMKGQMPIACMCTWTERGMILTAQLHIFITFVKGISPNGINENCYICIIVFSYNRRMVSMVLVARFSSGFLFFLGLEAFVRGKTHVNTSDKSDYHQ